MRPVVLDIDGVLADFSRPFRRVLERYGAQLRPFEDGEPNVWDWELLYGATPEQREAAWEFVGAVPAWWGSLPLHTDVVEDVRTDLFALSQRVPVVCVTARPANTWGATTRWLRQTLGLALPVVVAPRKKWQAIASLDPLIVVDDSPKVLTHLSQHAAWEYSRPISTVLVARPYNNGVDTGGAEVVGSTGEAIRRCRRALD